MARALTLCNVKDCTTKIPQGQGRCDAHRAKADAARRVDGNPYNTAGHQRFRRAVLDRDPICVICNIAIATVADHWPNERRDLVTDGLNPDDPARGRGLCVTCHNEHTAASSPGGWARYE